MAASYTNEQIAGLYELGRMYFETGYFAPAERMFQGVLAVSENLVPARIGLGAVKLELGLYQEAADNFRDVLNDPEFGLQAKLGLCATFIAIGEFARAGSILRQAEQDISEKNITDPDLRVFWEALMMRCVG